MFSQTVRKRSPTVVIHLGIVAKLMDNRSYDEMSECIIRQEVDTRE